MVFSISFFMASAQTFPGSWSGEMELSGSKLELIFKISADENGELSATMDVPAQGAYNLPVSKAEVKNDSVFLHVEMIAGRFSGRLANNTTIDGSWSQSGLSFPLTLTRSEKSVELKRPQTPQPPFPYIEEEVSFKNTQAEIKFAGTLTLPENVENCPAVILISGSGAQDRDETIFQIVKAEEDSVARLDRLQRTFTNGMYPMMNDDQKKAIDLQVNAVNSTWFRYFLTYDPRPALSRLKCPVLALNGGKDLQVSAHQNLPAIEKALAEEGNKNFKTMELPNLNHLFQNSETGTVSEYAQIEETISPKVLEIMTEWIREVVD